jgi:hypothetical protein
MKKLNSLFESEVLTAMNMKLSSEMWQILTDISAAFTASVIREIIRTCGTTSRRHPSLS